MVSVAQVICVSALLRILLILYGCYHDAKHVVKYTGESRMKVKDMAEPLSHSLIYFHTLSRSPSPLLSFFSTRYRLSSIHGGGYFRVGGRFSLPKPALSIYSHPCADFAAQYPFAYPLGEGSLQPVWSINGYFHWKIYLRIQFPLLSISINQSINQTAISLSTI